MESPKKLPLQFNKPLVIYRIKTPTIFDITKEMLKYLIEKNYVEYIYLENQDKIKSDPDFQDEKYSKYLKVFDPETQDSNICIIIGGDGTCLWANQVYKDKKKPPFFCFHGGNLGFLAVYEPKDYKTIFDQLYMGGEYNLIDRKEIKCTVYKKTKDNTNDDINNFEGYEKVAVYNALNELILEKKRICLIYIYF